MLRYLFGYEIIKKADEGNKNWWKSAPRNGLQQKCISSKNLWSFIFFFYNISMNTSHLSLTNGNIYVDAQTKILNN